MDPNRNCGALNFPNYKSWNAFAGHHWSPLEPSTLAPVPEGAGTTGITGETGGAINLPLTVS
jgi:hypothetical protein